MRFAADPRERDAASPGPLRATPQPTAPCRRLLVAPEPGCGWASPRRGTLPPGRTGRGGAGPLSGPALRERAGSSSGHPRPRRGEAPPQLPFSLTCQAGTAEAVPAAAAAMTGRAPLPAASGAAPSAGPPPAPAAWPPPAGHPSDARAFPARPSPSTGPPAEPGRDGAPLPATPVPGKGPADLPGRRRQWRRRRVPAQRGTGGRLPAVAMATAGRRGKK